MVGGVDLNHRPLGYEGVSSSNLEQRLPTSPNIQFGKPRPEVGILCGPSAGSSDRFRTSCGASVSHSHQAFQFSGRVSRSSKSKSRFA
jgi:hypothetical protein